MNRLISRLNLRNALASFALVAFIPATSDAAATSVSLNNADFESGSAGWAGLLKRASHGSFPGTPNKTGLGRLFMFHPPADAALSQTTTAIFVSDTTYNFGSMAVGGNNGFLNLATYEIGYDAGSGFQTLAVGSLQPNDNSVGWSYLEGVSYTTGGSGPELGESIIVRLYTTDNGGGPSHAVWFDNVSLEYLPAVPEPSSALLLGLGGLLIFGARRRAAKAP